MSFQKIALASILALSVSGIAAAADAAAPAAAPAADAAPAKVEKKDHLFDLKAPEGFQKIRMR